MSESLTALRDRLTEIDQELLVLAAERQSIALQIGQAKRQLHRGTRDFAREKVVLDRGRAAASGLGLDASVAERLLTTLIEASLTAQERARVIQDGQGADRRVLIIGGNGKLGGWFARFMLDQGYQVTIADPGGAPAGVPWVPDWRALELSFDCIVVAAPLQISGQILLQLAARRPSGVVFDVGSLKSPLRAGLMALSEAGVSVTSVHPMFGPDTQLLSGRHVVFCDCGHPEATDFAQSLFANTMATQVHTSLDEHDQAIAFVLGLSHALNIAFFTVLAESGRSIPRLAEISSTTFASQLEVARRVSNENPHLYYEIQASNDFGHLALDALHAATAALRDCVSRRDEAAFVEMMRAGQEALRVVIPSPAAGSGD